MFPLAGLVVTAAWGVPLAAWTTGSNHYKLDHGAAIPLGSASRPYLQVDPGNTGYYKDKNLTEQLSPDDSVLSQENVWIKVAFNHDPGDQLPVMAYRIARASNNSYNTITETYFGVSNTLENGKCKKQIAETTKTVYACQADIPEVAQRGDRFSLIVQPETQTARLRSANRDGTPYPAPRGSGYTYLGYYHPNLIVSPAPSDAITAGEATTAMPVPPELTFDIAAVPAQAEEPSALEGLEATTDATGTLTFTFSDDGTNSTIAGSGSLDIAPLGSGRIISSIAKTSLKMGDFRAWEIGGTDASQSKIYDVSDISITGDDSYDGTKEEVIPSSYTSDVYIGLRNDGSAKNVMLSGSLIDDFDDPEVYDITGKKATFNGTLEDVLGDNDFHIEFAIGNQKIVFTTQAPPEQPSGLTATAADGQVSLSWTDPQDSTITKYQVQQKAGSGSYGSWSDISGSVATTTSHTVSGLSNGTAYGFKVRAVNAGGAGAESAEVSATPLAAPSRPTGLSATASDTKVTLMWANPQNTSISKYQLRYGAGAIVPTTATWGDIADSASTTSHEVTGLTNGTQYAFEIRAVNATGNSDASATVTATPATPRTLTFTFSDDGSTVTIDAAGSLDFSAFKSLASTTIGIEDTIYFDDTDIWAIGADSSGINSLIGSYQLSDLTTKGFETYSGSAAAENLPNYSAEFFVRFSDFYNIMRVDSDNLTGKIYDPTGDKVTFTGTLQSTLGDNDFDIEHAFGNQKIVFKTASPATVPAAPTGLAATVGDTQVDLAWTNPNDSNITKYQVRYGAGTTVPATATWEDISGSGTITHTVTGLTNATGYAFEIRAVNARGNSTASSTVTATPALAVPGAPTDLSATPGDTQATLNWTLPTNTSVIGDVQVRWKATADLPFAAADTWTGLSDGAATSHIATGLTNGTGYTFGVRATNTAGDGAAATTTATPNLAPAIQVSPATLTIAKGGSATFDVTLAAAPTDSVTINVASDDTDVTVSPTPLTFTTANYNTAQMVTVNMAANPSDGAATITLSATGGNYDTLTASVSVSSDAPPSFGTQTIPTQSYIQGAAITTLTLPEATGGDAPLTYSLTPSLPAGLSFDAATRTVTGTPTAHQAASAYTYTVTDVNGDTATLTFNISVTGTLTIGGVADADQAENGVYTGSATLSGAIGAVEWNLGGDDGGRFALSNKSTTGVTVTLQAQNYEAPGDRDRDGVYEYTLTAMDAYNNIASTNVSVTITDVKEERTLTFSGLPTQDETQDVRENEDEFKYSIAVSGAVSDVTWTLSGDDADMFELSNSNWFPRSSLAFVDLRLPPQDYENPKDADGNNIYDYALTATDADDNTISFSKSVVILNVINEATPPPAAPTGLAIEEVGETMVKLKWDNPNDANITGYQLLYAKGSSVPISDVWRDISGSNATTTTHTVTGLTGATQYAFSIRAKNDKLNGDIGNSPRSTVTATTEAVLLSTNTLEVNQGGSGTFNVKLAAEPSGTVTVALSSEDNGVTITPSSLTFTSDNYNQAQTVQSTKTTGGTATIKLNASGGGYDDSLEKSLTLRANALPSFGTETVVKQSYIQDTAIATLTLPVAADGDGTLSYALRPALPTGLSFNASNRTISGTPTAAQAETEYTYTVRDQDGDTAELTFKITVAKGSDAELC